MTPVMKITETLVVLFLVLFCYLFLDKFLFRGELGEICFGPTCRALARWLRRQADRLDPPRRRRRRTAAVTPKDDALVVTRDYGAGQRTPARAASRHSGARGTIQTRATIHLYRQATAIRNIALCKRPFRGGYIRNLRRSPRRKRTP